MTTPGQINDAAHLRTLPDGTIISWYRIPGDLTSEAVAFVRREVDHYDDGTPRVEVWISPGGWDPKSIEEAGVTFPAKVVRFGEFNPDAYLPGELPVLGEALEQCVHGGTWAREKALECAVRYFQGNVRSTATVFKVAGQFEAWLDRNEDPLSLRLQRAADTIEEARDRVGRTDNPVLAISLDGIRRTADWLAEQGE